MRRPRRHRLHGIEGIVIALPAPDADLRDQVVLGAERELTTHAEAVHAGVKASHVRPRVDDVDLLRGDALSHEPPLDRLRYRHHRRHAPRGVAEPVEGVEREADAAVQDEDGDPREQPRHEGEGARLALLGVHDLDPVLANDAHKDGDGLHVDLGAHGQGIVRETSFRALLHPALARPCGDDDVVPALLEPAGQLEELYGRSREVVALRIELEDAERLAHFLKNALTPATTSSISASVWPAEMGRVRISLTMRSVCSSGGGLRCSTAG